MVMGRRKPKAWKPKELSRFRKWKINKIVQWNMRHGRSNMDPKILGPVQTVVGLGVESRALPKGPPKRIELTKDSMLFI